MTLRAVVVGSGSAGRRHAAALRRLRPDAEIVVVRRTGSTQPAAELERIGASTVTSLTAATDDGCDLGVVASPATHHRQDAEGLMGAAAAVLVEKPLAATVEDGERIRAAAGDRPVVVGYHLRWSETVRRLAATLADELPGPPESFGFSVGQHLSQWRPGADPRTGVSARSDLGGGALLELSHELDAVRHLLGPVDAVLGAELRTDGAPTDGIVDTVADLRLELRDGAVGRVHLDMTSDPAHRRWRVTSGAVTVTGDLLAGTIHVDDGHHVREVHRSDEAERDRAEDALMSHLLTLLDGAEPGSRDPGCSVEDGIATLRVVAAARAAAERRGAIEVGTAPDRPELRPATSALVDQVRPQ